MLRILLALAVVSTMGCASRRQLSQDNADSKNNTIKVWANWVKNKGKKFDIQFAMENLTDKHIIVKLREVQCARGKTTGRIKHTFFNTGERTMDFMPNEMKQFNLVCHIGSKASGPFNMRIVNVYDNPSGDGSTVGKPIVKNVIWSIEED